MGNKADEQACLDYAIKECLAQHGISKRIGLLLSGEDIQRDKNERPDFMRISAPDGNHGSVVLGIEHFRVDHFSRELTNNRVGSYGIGYEKNLKKSVDTWQPQISSDKEIPAGALESIGELVAQLLSQQIQATYNSFIGAFSYSLNKHIESVDFYHSQLEKYAGSHEKKLAFLIEIHSDFHKLFFHDKKGTHYGEKTIPLFDELVTIMEKIAPGKVHFLILCFIMTGDPRNSHHIYRSIAEKATNSDAAYRYADAGQLSIFFEKAVSYKQQTENQTRIDEKITRKVFDDEVESYIYDLNAEKISTAILHEKKGFVDVLLAFMKTSEEHALYVIQSVDKSYQEICGRSFAAYDPFALII